MYNTNIHKKQNKNKAKGQGFWVILDFFRTLFGFKVEKLKVGEVWHL